MGRVSVAFVDDQPILLEGVSRLFAQDQDVCVVAAGRSAADAVRIARDVQPDILVIDVNALVDALDAIRQIRRNRPDTGVVAFSAPNDVGYVLRVLEAGAGSYVLKGGSVEELRLAILAVARGETYIAQDLAAKVVGALRTATQPNPAALRLSHREKQIVELLLCGRTNKEIAGTLELSDKTVKHYMGILMQKFHVRNRLEVAIAAQKLPAHDYFLRPAPVAGLAH